MSSAVALKRYALAIAFMLGIAQVSSAGNFEVGIAAHARGDYATALKLLRPLAEEGDSQAQIKLGTMYNYGHGVPEDRAEALKWYQLAANKGDRDAQFLLGIMYSIGRGVLKDDTEAAKWYRLAADQGRAAAQSFLGRAYQTGRGVPKNDAEAAKWYRLAAIQGNTEAQVELGVMYAEGQGVEQNYFEAVKWYRLAASEQDARAQLLLGIRYADGKGVPQNYAEAARLYRLAAEQGSPNAQLFLGMAYADGQGVPQDFVRAHMWVNVAGVGGDRDAATSRDLLEGRMTTEQIAQAQKMAKICVESDYKRCGEADNAQAAPGRRSDSALPKRRTGPVTSSAIIVPLQKHDGTLVVPVRVNDAVTLSFVVDSGAADVSIPSDVVTTLMRTGTLTPKDFLGKRTYLLADGTRIPSETFRIRSMTVGGRTVQNVTGSVSSVEGSLLLGQSFLSRFRSWSIDNGKQILLLQ